MEEIEKAFGETTSIVLGRKLSKMTDYEEWLLKHVKGKVEKRKSKISGKTVFVPSVEFYGRMGGNIVTLGESLELGKRHLGEEEVEKLSLENADKMLEKIKTTTPEIIYSRNIGTEESSCYGPTQHCYKVTFTWFSKLIAYSFWARDSERLFGCSNVAAQSSFCIKCHSSTKLTRCFEVNDSNNCADCYFCHNCENVQDSMFCFNAKNLRNAIGNVQLAPDEYRKIKARMLLQIADELEGKKGLVLDIFNISQNAPI